MTTEASTTQESHVNPALSKDDEQHLPETLADDVRDYIRRASVVSDADTTEASLYYDASTMASLNTVSAVSFGRFSVLGCFGTNHN